jgi:hypothetical protein
MTLKEQNFHDIAELYYLVGQIETKYGFSAYMRERILEFVRLEISIAESCAKPVTMRTITLPELEQLAFASS